jgi:Uma2 family endonuclease
VSTINKEGLKGQQSSEQLKQPVTPSSTIEYPDTDGKPMGETGIHVRVILYLYHALCNFFLRNKRTDAYVAADMFLYYEEGNPKACKAPDVMVILGVDGTYERRSFKMWEEQATPAVIFEVISRSTWIEDLVDKGALYLRLGVKEYFILDPLHEFLQLPFQGMRLVDGHYEPISPNADGSLTCQQLGIHLRRDGAYLRVTDAETGERIPALEETYEYAERMKEIAEQETQRAEQEAKRAEQEAQRAEQEAQRAEQQTQRAEQQTQRAEQQAQRAAEAEAENARLRALLEQTQNRGSANPPA